MVVHWHLARKLPQANLRSGCVIFNRQGALVARRLDITGGTLIGDTVTLADSVSYDNGFDTGGFAVSSAGRVAYRAGGLEARSNTDVWVIDILRGGKTRFTDAAAADEAPIWSPDGTQIAFASIRKGNYDLYLKPSSGPGGEELLRQSPQSKFVEDWSADGRFVLYREAGPKTGWDLWALPMVGDRKPIEVVNSPYEERDGQFSPDGRWVAYQSNVTGRFEIYVQPFPGPGRNWHVSTAGGTFPRWRADGKELFFIAPNAKLMSVPVTISGSTFEAGSPIPLFQTRIVTGGVAGNQTQYSVSRDGRFLINTQVDDSTTTPITLILNWHPERGK